MFNIIFLHQSVIYYLQKKIHFYFNIVSSNDGSAFSDFVIFTCQYFFIFVDHLKEENKLKL